MARLRVHLICNAHLDPVWQWDWEDGLAEAISTFRTAADLCERHGDFVFNHNESLLYEWVEAHEPHLFARIRKLVAAGRWHIMGGWFLQSDCTMPHGESLVRQILVGRRWFRDRFGVEPTVAMNVDSFGHSRGLVQILVKSGYTGYLVGRPDPERYGIPRDPARLGVVFDWLGFDGSRIAVHTHPPGYASRLGLLEPMLRNYLAEHAPRADSPDLITWGIGDHGGGASAEDLRILAQVTADAGKVGIRLIQSTPERYFRDMRRTIPRAEVARELGPHSTGCYTSMARVKTLHRRLEADLFAAEKMALAASANGLLAYPRAELAEAQRDLLLSQFHDALPGSGIQDVEDHTLRLLGRGIEALSRVRARSFVALCAGQEREHRQDRPPILVWNPHPWPVKTEVTCEFRLHDFNWRRTFVDVSLLRDGKRIPCQVEQERAQSTLDWGKRLVFRTTLAPGMNRFSTRLREVPAKPAPRIRALRGVIEVATAQQRVRISARSGLLLSWLVGGRETVRSGACRAVVVADGAHSWRPPTEPRSGGLVGAFRRVATAREAGRGSGLSAGLEPVRVIEDGPVRTVVEAVFAYRSSLLVLRYGIAKEGVGIEVEILVRWNEPRRMLKLELPLAGAMDDWRVQTAFGVEHHRPDGTERVVQRWQAAVCGDRVVTVVNDGRYGADASRRMLRTTLLRSPAYSCQEHETRIGDRWTPSIDIGQHRFRLWLSTGPAAGRLVAVEREALLVHEAPYALSFYPPGSGRRPDAPVLISDPAVHLVAAKQEEEGAGTILRLFNPGDRRRRIRVRMPAHGADFATVLAPWELQTWRIPRRGGPRPCDLLEGDLRS